MLMRSFPPVGEFASIGRAIGGEAERVGSVSRVVAQAHRDDVRIRDTGAPLDTGDHLRVLAAARRIYDPSDFERNARRHTSGLWRDHGFRTVAIARQNASDMRTMANIIVRGREVA